MQTTTKQPIHVEALKSYEALVRYHGVTEGGWLIMARLLDALADSDADIPAQVRIDLVFRARDCRDRAERAAELQYGAAS